MNNSQVKVSGYIFRESHYSKPQGNLLILPKALIVLITIYRKSHLLLPDGGLVATHGAHGLQLRLLLDRPLCQLPEREEERVPVFRVVLESIPVNKGNKKYEFTYSKVLR